MLGTRVRSPIRAARMTASVFGTLAGLGGLTHGIGETRQGNVAAGGVLINSWTEGPIAAYMGGEPGMTFIPNLLVTGALTIFVSLTIIVFACAFVKRKNGGLVLLLLSIILLLVGGGFAPPIIGIISGVAALAINAPLTWWRKHLSASVRRVFALVWPWVFGVCLINGVFLVVGSVILVYFFGLNNPDLFVESFLFGVLILLVTVVTGIAYDIENGGRSTVL